MKQNIRISQNQIWLAEALAHDLQEIIRETRTGKNLFTIGLSGGTTPDMLFSVLGNKYNDETIWKDTAFFWVDERCVPQDDEESNFRKAFELFFSKTHIDPYNIHRIRGEDNPVMEAKRYSSLISKNTVHKNGIPSFNLLLLGLGEDGHTASIFPGNENLFGSDRIYEVTEHPMTKQKRITITGSVINNASQIIFLAAGKNKARIVKKILEQNKTGECYPASLVEPVDGRVIWYLDQEAASGL